MAALTADPSSLALSEPREVGALLRALARVAQGGQVPVRSAWLAAAATLAGEGMCVSLPPSRPTPQQRETVQPLAQAAAPRPTAPFIPTPPRPISAAGSLTLLSRPPPPPPVPQMGAAPPVVSSLLHFAEAHPRRATPTAVEYRNTAAALNALLFRVHAEQGGAEARTHTAAGGRQLGAGSKGGEGGLRSVTQAVEAAVSQLRAAARARAHKDAVALAAKQAMQ